MIIACHFFVLTIPLKKMSELRKAYEDAEQRKKDVFF